MLERLATRLRKARVFEGPIAYWTSGGGGENFLGEYYAAPEDEEKCCALVRLQVVVAWSGGGWMPSRTCGRTSTPWYSWSALSCPLRTSQAPTMIAWRQRTSTRCGSLPTPPTPCSRLRDFRSAWSPTPPPAWRGSPPGDARMLAVNNNSFAVEVNTTDEFGFIGV